MTRIKHAYWEVIYTSCEGNKRFSIARSPEDWHQDDVERAIQLGGVGDDPAEIHGVYEIYGHTDELDYTWDFDNEE